MALGTGKPFFISPVNDQLCADVPVKRESAWEIQKFERNILQRSGKQTNDCLEVG